ncbi:hypothetical protein ARSEF4850_008253 [Beauveria asiatica]
MQLPCVEVSQLASSTSFYAAVLQPLGLRYLLSESIACGPDFATFGCCRGPVLHLRQIARPTVLRLSTIRISAPTQASIQAFYRQGLEAGPASMFAVDDSVNHSTIFDLDGNRMQAVYTGHVCRPDVTTGQYTLILDPQQDTHVFQVLDWNNCKPEPCGVKNIDDGGRTTETLDTQGSREATDSFQTKTEDNNTPIVGISTVLGALMGVAAGAAAGAAITYGVMSARKPDRVGSGDFYDTQSHVTARKTDVSARRHDSGEVKRSYVSAKAVPLPPSRVGTSEFFEIQSQISAKKSDASAGHHHNMEDKRTRVSARDIPLPSSRAVSVSLPTWESNIGYEEGASWVVSRMTTGYPSITELSHAIVSAYGREDQQAMLFSTPQAVERCLDFMRKRALEALAIQFQSISFELNLSEDTPPVLSGLASTIAAALFPADAFGLAKQYWQHTGDGISSRRAEFCHDLLRAGIMVPSSSKNAIREITLKSSRGPKRYQRTNSVDETAGPNAKAVSTTSNDTKESSRFLEERFGRNLDLSLAKGAKSAIRRRIAGSLAGEDDLLEEAVLDLTLTSLHTRNLSESDIYLFPTGMNAIFNAHRALMAARGRLQSVSFGFPYVDTLKILEKFGPGCIFYGHGSSSDLNELEKRLEKGELILALFCEFPGNPLLVSPDLQRIRRLADIFDFAIVVDETIGTFANVNVFQSADIVVSSLTKIFSGDSNVMGGSAVLNPSSKYYRPLKSAMDTVVEDNYWPEDIIFMERNSRDFLNRVERVNANAEAICDILRGHSLVKDLFYPKFNSSRDLYERFRLPQGGYGGLLSVVFHQQVSAQAFYDAMDIAKGPSLGTNFTLCSPYVLLAHYNELPWAAQFGVDPNLVRVSVGLEGKDILSETFCRALQAAENATKQIDEQRTDVQHCT